MLYGVNEIFPSIQGEGCNTGIPMVVVRLQGCDLRCSFCDTERAQDPRGGYELSTDRIIREVQGYPGIDWVLITGGEPTTQNLTELCQALLKKHYRIALETHGNRVFDPALFNWICVSPKVSPNADVSTGAVDADEIKFLVRDEGSLKYVKEYLERHSTDVFSGNPVICLQPVSQDPAATELCYQTCMKMGWRLSIQVHKLIDVR